MIERALRRELEPTVRRYQRVHLAKRLTIIWLCAALLGCALAALYWLWGWQSAWAVGLLCAGTVAATLAAAARTQRLEPDYHAIARAIEQEHPDIKAMLLAALEQQPQGLGGQLDYLQRRLIKDTLRHAAYHEWVRSVPRRTVIRTDVMRYAALVMLLVVVSQSVPSCSFMPRLRRPAFLSRTTRVTVTPGNTTVELGAPVVIAARFDGRVPNRAALVWVPSGQDAQHRMLTKSLDDPVFGGMIEAVSEDLVYHIEYDGQRSGDFHIQVFDVPDLVQADARIEYPEYTHLSGKVITHTQRVSVVEGSRVTLTLTLNMPVASAVLKPRQGPAPVLTVDEAAENVYRTTLTAAETRRYELHLTSAQGRSNAVPPRFVLEVLPNVIPTVTARFPGQDVDASALEELTLEAEVSDDYGLIDYGLTYQLAGTAHQDVPLNAAASDGVYPIRYTVALEAMGARPDQLLSYYFWADDVGPDGQPRRTTSDIYFAEIRPFDEVFRESESFQDPQQQQRQQNQAGEQNGLDSEQLARLQKQIITATWNIKQQTERGQDMDTLRQDLGVVRDSQGEALNGAGAALSTARDDTARQALQNAAEHMRTALDQLTRAAESESTPDLVPALGAEQSAYQALLQLREQEYQVTQSRSGSRAGNRNSQRFQQQLRQLELRQQEDRYATQRLAQNQPEARQQEDLQVMNRLRDLARRQEEVSNRLREAQAALQRAQNEQQREEALRELKRLRDEQRQALNDVDELQQRMNQPQNRQRMADAREQLDRSRSRIEQSAESLEQGQISEAGASATRAQRELEQMREDLRERTSGAFTQTMRSMRDQARELAEQQQAISERIRTRQAARQQALSGGDENQEVADQLQEQRQRTESLMDQMRETSEAAETAEPLLSRTLYDTLRQASTDRVEQALETTEQLVRRDFLNEAQRLEQQANDGVQAIRRGVEQAAQRVLGDENESLRQARQGLDETIRQVDQEMARARGPEPGQTPAPSDANQSGAGGSLEDMRPGPLTGRDFRAWSNRLRDVEEMLTEPDMRNEAARVRDRARQMRAEFVRHGTEPQWDLVQENVLTPLVELRRQVSDQLAHTTSNEALVPIDRDPVPQQYTEQVRRYFENLGDKP